MKRELNHPYYDSFDEILFEAGDEIFCLSDETSNKEACITEHEVYEAIKYSTDLDMVLIKDDSGESQWVEAELFVSCDDMDDIYDFEEE